MRSVYSNSSATLSYRLLWYREQVLHVLDLLKVKRHVGCQHDLNDQRPQFSDIQAHHTNTRVAFDLDRWRLHAKMPHSYMSVYICKVLSCFSEVIETVGEYTTESLSAQSQYDARLTVPVPWPVLISHIAKGKRLSYTKWLVTFHDGKPAKGHPFQY